MAEFKKTFIGGMRAEIWNYTFPFILFTVTPQLLQIKILGFNRFTFTPDQVLGFKVRSGGIQIFHNIQEYPTLILFWGNGKKVASALKDAGYMQLVKDEGDDEEYKQHVYLGIIGFFFIFSFVALAMILIFLSN